MGHVQDLWTRKAPGGGRERTAAWGRGSRWQARWDDPGGFPRVRVFRTKDGAEAHLAAVTTDMARGTYVDPEAGRKTVAAYAEGWLADLTSNPSTRDSMASRFRVHIVPALGDVQLRHLRPAAIRSWLADLDHLAPSYRKVLLANLSSMLTAAVDDGLLAAKPCKARSVKSPALTRARVDPWPEAQVAAVVRALPDWFSVAAVLCAGCGLRQGEAFGLRVEDVDFLRRTLRVRQQVKLDNRGQPYLAAPKRGKERDVPLPGSVASAIAAHLQARPARSVTLSWDRPDGRPRTARLVLTSRESAALNRNYVNPKVWKPALLEAGVQPSRDNGMHALRHHYASLLIREGVSPRTLAEYLGHDDPGFTLRVYSHLWPESSTVARAAVDRSLGALTGISQGDGKETTGP